MSVDGGEEKSAQESLKYKGSVSGLKGFLSSRITKIAGAVAGEDPTAQGGGRLIPIAMIFPNPDQPRQVFDPKSLEELAATMKEVGQAQAITVRPRDAGFEIISGERRYRAARLAGLSHLECIVKDVGDNEAQLLSLVENLQRQDLLPIEEAHYLKKVLKENKSLSLEKLAKMLGSHKSTLSEKIQLTEVPEEEQRLLYARGKGFTHRHWRVLSRVKDPAFLKELLKRAIEEQLSVAELEKSLEAAGIPKIKKAKTSPAKENAPWTPPLSLNGTRLSFRTSNLDVSLLTPERKQLIRNEVEKILALLG
ncbi:MAG: ParB/RepB/Spo0J family partition protein [Bdellovibrionota bacterium]